MAILTYQLVSLLHMIVFICYNCAKLVMLSIGSLTSVIAYILVREVQALSDPLYTSGHAALPLFRCPLPLLSLTCTPQPQSHDTDI